MAIRKIKKRSSAKIRTATVAGAPGIKQAGEKWNRRTPQPFRRKLGIRTLIKNDPSDGLTQSEAKNFTTVPGVVTGDSGGYKGVTEVRQQPASPAKPGRNIKRVATPSPTNGGGIRSPFNLRKRVGRGK